MRDVLEVERLANGAASSLARYLAHELGLSANVLTIKGSCVEVETQSGSLPELLSAVEKWGQRNAISPLCVRLNGRAYILESPKTANTPHPATTT